VLSFVLTSHGSGTVATEVAWTEQLTILCEVLCSSVLLVLMQSCSLTFRTEKGSSSLTDRLYRSAAEATKLNTTTNITAPAAVPNSTGPVEERSRLLAQPGETARDGLGSE